MLESVSILGFIGPGGPEFIVVMLVLLVMFGAKDAPRIFRKLNEMLNSLRSTADGFKREIMYGDLGATADSASTSDDDDYGYDDGYSDDYEDDYDPEDETEERDYSDETFQSLEEDLEQADAPAADEEPAAEENDSEEEDDDARKA